jgi:N-acetylneuraminic acid mutarotase
MSRCFALLRFALPVVLVACATDHHLTAPTAQRVSTATSTVTVASPTLVADGTSTTIITVTLRDTAGLPLGGSGGKVLIGVTSGSVGGVVDHGDGTYSAIYTSPTVAAPVTVSAFLGTARLLHPVEIILVGGPMDLVHTTVSASIATQFADGLSASTIVVQERDVYDNPTGNGTADILLMSNIGTFDPVVQTSPGRYESPLRSSTIGAATITARVGGQILGGTASVSFVGGFWKERAPMPYALQAMGADVINGSIYIVGGKQWDSTSYSARTLAFDPATNTWHEGTPMPTARGELAAAAVNGILYAIGGFSRHDLSTVEAYDPVADTWSARAPMPTARENLGIGVINGVIYAVGGNARGGRRATANATRMSLVGGPTVAFNILEESEPLETVEAYDPVSDKWTVKAPMLTPRSQFAAGVINGKLYVVGGTNGTSVLTTVEVYDPATDQWATRASLPNFGRQSLAVAVMNGTLYAIGGLVSYVGTQSVAKYDPATDSWAAGVPVPAALQGLSAVALNNKLYAFGGACYDVVFAGTYGFTP